jgi:hypothetical protein
LKNITIQQEDVEDIITLYKETYSVSQLLKEDKYKKIGRDVITKLLKDNNIFEGLNGPNYLKKKVENLEKIMIERYGIKNWGQTKSAGYVKNNKIPYKKITYLSDDYKKYRIEVNKETEKTIKNHFKKLPKYCFYTKILFSDEEGPTNPNDPRKRSIDHRVPVLHCYLNNLSVEEAASKNNIIFILKYVNSVKGQTLEESFIPVAEKIKKVFINEGYQSKKTVGET